MQAVSDRFRESDLLQILLAYVALLFFALVVTWPQAAGQANDSWYALVQTKVVALGLLSLYYGSTLHAAPPHAQLSMLGALLFFHLLSVPFEVAGYAASFPPVPLGWSPLVNSLEVVACFALGVVLGRVLAFMRLTVLQPLAAPLVLVGFVFFDLWVEMSILNPFTAVTRVDLTYLLVRAALALLYALALLLRHPRFMRDTPASSP